MWAFFIVIAAASIYIYPGVLFTKFKIGFSLMVVIIFIFLCYTQVKINIEISRIAVKDVVVGGGGEGGSIYSPPSNTNANNNRAEQNRFSYSYITNGKIDSVVVWVVFCPPGYRCLLYTSPSPRDS